MKKRLMTAGILISILLGVFAFRLINTYGVYIFDLFVGVIAIFSALEFAKLLERKGYYISQMATGLFPSFMFAGHVFYFIFNLNLYYYIIIQLSLLILAFLITFFCYLFLNTKEVVKYREENKLTKFKGAIKISLKTFLTFIYPTMFLLSLMLLNRIDSLNIAGINSFGGYLGWVTLIVAFLIPILTDTFAMLCGMFIKGPKLCPSISPKKTISGAICGIIFPSLILGALYYLFSVFNVISVGFAFVNIKAYHFVILGFIGAIVSQLGDIFESYLKRKSNIKDSGNIFPGHGGFLDRFDSHIFCAPFVFAYFILIIIL